MTTEPLVPSIPFIPDGADEETLAYIRRGHEILRRIEPEVAPHLGDPDITRLFGDAPPKLAQIHMHLHTPDGSLLDGFARIDKLMALAKEMGMPAVGVSEHGTMASHFKFDEEARKAGIKPIFGMEAYMAPNHKWKKADYEQSTVLSRTIEMEDGETKSVPRLYYLTDDEVEAGGYTVITDIRSKDHAKAALARYNEELLIRAHEEDETLSASQAKKRVSSLKSANTRSGIRCCVKEVDPVRRLFEWRSRRNHLMLVAKDNAGYKNLLALNALAHLEGKYVKPQIDYHMIRRHGKGLIGFSACLGSDISQAILKGRIRLARNLIRFYAKYLDEFYLEIQPSKQEEQHIVNAQLIAFSEELGLPLICTSDVHMLTPAEKRIHAALTTIGKNKDEDSEETSVYDSCYFMSTEEILGRGIPWEAVLNTMRVAAKCDVSLEDTDIKYPEFDVPQGYDFDSYLGNLSSDGLFHRLMDLPYEVDIEAYIQRLEYELEVIKEKKIAAYFVIVWDYINFARDNDILVGPGRGSGAGSLVLYALGITDLDPIKYELLFERFLNPERPGFPDVDSDFDYQRRDEIIAYVSQKYGRERVAQIGTYSTLSTKAVLKDVGRALGIDHELINELNKHVPIHQGKAMELSEALDIIPELQRFQERYPDLFDLSLQVQSMPRSAGKHACGVLISPTDISHSIPLMADKEGNPLTQYDGPVLEINGFIKFDFLGLKNLSVLKIASELVEENHGVKIDPQKLPYDDPKVFEKIQSGDTYGLFQIESSGMQEMFRGLNTVDFESVIAGLSLYRPGPMAFIPDYQSRANGTTEVEYFHPDAERLVGKTFGIMIYQEQLMEIAGVFGGYSMAERDLLRKACGKKSQAVMDKVLPELKARIIENGYDEEVGDHVVRLIEPFVGYGFNRSHAAAYAALTYQTAYFKTYYPVEFFTALLTVFHDKDEKIITYTQNAKQNGITILPPDINESMADFIIQDGAIRYGLSGIKGLGEASYNMLMDMRPFESADDLVARVQKKFLNKKAIESLSLSGALDSFFPKETNRYRIYDKMLRMRGDFDNGLDDEIKGFNHKVKLDLERKYLKVYLSGHPLDGITVPVEWDSLTSGDTIRSSGVVDAIRVIITKKGQKEMAFVTLNFLEGPQEVVIFPDMWADYRDQIRKEMVLKVKLEAKYSPIYDRMSLILQDVRIPIRINKHLLPKPEED